MNNKFLILFFLAFTSVNICAQDSLAHSNLKNTIRWDPTPMALIGAKSIVFGYERIINPNQSISINIGTLVKRPFTDKYGREIHFFDEHNTGGFLASVDYRFYFKNRNKRLAPDGVYWGPYFSYYQLWFDVSSDILENGATVNTINLDTKLEMTSLGLQLGYQFVIGKRFTIDMILVGPSYSYYKARLGIDAEIELDEDSNFYKRLEELFGEIAPGLNTILIDKDFTSSGKLDFSYYGFRYLVQFGFRF